MVPTDRRYTNYTVDGCVVRGRLVTGELETGDIHVTKEFRTPGTTIQGSMSITNSTVDIGTLQSTNVDTTTLNTTTENTSVINATNANIGTLNATTASITSLVSGSLSTDETIINASNANTNVLWTTTPASVVSGYLPIFNANGLTSVVPTSPAFIAQLKWRSLFGDGSDGNVTIAAPTTLTRDMYYDTLTVNDALTPAGNIIFCKTECIINTGGSMIANGGNGGAGSGSGANGGAAGAAAVSNGVFPSSPGTAGGSSASPDGGNLAVNSFFGGLGGVGGSSSTNSGGLINQTPIWINKATILNNPTMFPLLMQNGTDVLGGVAGTGGTGGAADTVGIDQAGGGGGGAGGWIVIYAPTITINGTGFISAVGGNGGDAEAGGDPAGSGGGGGGGVVYFVAFTVTGAVLNVNILVAGGQPGVPAQPSAIGQVGADGVFSQHLLFV